MSSPPERPVSRRAAPDLLLAVLGLWPAAVAVSTGLLMPETLRRMWTAVRWNPSQRLSVALAAGLGVALLWPVLAPRRWRPRSPLVVLAATAAILALAFAAASRALDALLLLGCFLLAAWEAGRLMLARLHLPGTGILETALFRAGLGASVLSLLGLALGLLARLDRTAAWALLGLLLGSAAFHGWRLLPQRREWRARLQARLAALEPGRMETAWIGLTLATLLAAFTLALAPEVQSDAVRMHLAVARRFAESGKVEILDQFWVTPQPLLAQILYTFGLLMDDTISAKLLHAAAGLGLTLAAAAAARKLAGRTGAVVAASLVATLPLVAWLLGTAYVDLFAAFYSLLAVLAMLNWQRTAARTWLLVAGMAAGSALAAKLAGGGVGMGICLAILLVGRRGAGLVERLRGLLAFSLGLVLSLGPWLVRSTVLTGEVPGVRFLRDALAFRRGPPPASLANLPGFGTGRSLPALLGLPWDLTFHTGLFGECMQGFAGLALLSLLPLAALLPRTRAVAALAVATLTATLLWFFTAQYLRYLLPGLGVLAVLLAVAYTQIQIRAARQPTWGRVLAARAYAGALVGSLLCAPALFLSTVFFVYPGSLPVGILAGVQTPEQYLVRRIPAYDVLRRLDRTLPPRTPVAMFPDGPQLYSRTRLISNMTGGKWMLLARSADELADRFAEHGVGYLIIDHPAIPPSWKMGFPLFRPEFLERHARLLYVREGVCLYRLGKDIGAVRPGALTRRSPPRPPGTRPPSPAAPPPAPSPPPGPAARRTRALPR